jgi:hypothetical protein
MVPGESLGPVKWASGKLAESPLVLFASDLFAPTAIEEKVAELIVGKRVLAPFPSFFARLCSAMSAQSGVAPATGSAARKTLAK